MAKSGATQDEMGKPGSLWALSVLVPIIPALRLRHGAPSMYRRRFYTGYIEYSVVVFAAVTIIKSEVRITQKDFASKKRRRF